MPRFLSPEWFEAVRAREGPALTGRGTDSGCPLVMQQVVTGTPYGEVRYLVVVESGSARLEGPLEGAEPRTPAPELTVTTDWPTAVAIARGDLAAQTALMNGLLRVRGNLARLADIAEKLAGHDPLPAEIRQATTF